MLCLNEDEVGKWRKGGEWNVKLYVCEGSNWIWTGK